MRLSAPSVVRPACALPLRLIGLLVLLGAGLLGPACHAPTQGARAPAPFVGTASELLVRAIAAEAEDADAVEPYLRVIDRVVSLPSEPLANAALAGALDALVTRKLPSLDTGLEQAAAFRTRASLVEVAQRLERAWALAVDAGPLMKPQLAAALHLLALRVGDEAAAVRWRERSGCVPAALVVGPVAWPPLRGLAAPSPIPASGPLPADLAGVPPFAAHAPSVATSADACDLDLSAPSTQRGVRLVVVELDNPTAQTVTVALTTSSAAVLELGGHRLVERPYWLGAERATVFGHAALEAGRTRLVARVAYNLDGQALRLAVWDPRGVPLRTSVPLAGSRADARISGAGALELTPGAEVGDAAGRVVEATSLLALGRAREAATKLDGPEPKAADLAAPTARALALLRLRAAQVAKDLPRTTALDRTQVAAESLLAACPTCWEGRIARAAALEERRGYAVGVFAALEALDVRPQEPGWTTRASEPELCFVAGRALRAGMRDVARQAYDALALRAPGSALLADLDGALHRRVGPELVRAACEGGTSRATMRCLLAHAARGDLAAVLRELARLRRLRGSAELLRDVEIQQLLLHGQSARALERYQAMPPAARSVAVLGALLASADTPAATLAKLRQQFLADLRTARDAPYGYEPLARLLGATDDPTSTLEREGLALVAQDRARAFLPGAGTAVLRHLESYDLDEQGLLRYRLYDLRRVSGTTDVAEVSAVGSPTIEGRSVVRVLRQRIHKRDGRVLDPDPQATGAQGQTELSQLESGDYVEAILEGFALPEDSGQLVVDTPDLLPLRTSVREAEIRFVRPAHLELDLWHHALLGAGEPAAGAHGSASRVETRWRLRDQAPRRIESGVPPLEARVALSFGTDSWARIATTLDERLRALDEKDPYVGKWLHELLGSEVLPRDRQIAKLVTAVGREVKEADPDALSDFVASLGGGPQRETARTYLEQARGSRSWVIHRALRELGVPSRIAVSEVSPFSASADFPAHVGRFRHPLVVAEVDGRSLWIDADVNGPPLPPGMVSPELRGRQALLPTGELLTVDAAAGFEADEIDVRLKLDAAGDAQGTFTALVHGEPAQQLADQLETTVGSERARLLRNVVLGWLPWADVHDVSLSSEEGSWQVGLRAEIAVPGFARPEGRDAKRWSLPGIEAVHRIHPRAETTTLGARFLAQAGRASDLAIDAPLLFHVHRRIELPAGATVQRLPTTLEIATPLLSASRALQSDATAIDEHFRVNLPAGTIPLAQVEPFAADVRRVDEGFAFATMLHFATPVAKPPSPPPKAPR